MKGKVTICGYLACKVYNNDSTLDLITMNVDEEMENNLKNRRPCNYKTGNFVP